MSEFPIIVPEKIDSPAQILALQAMFGDTWEKHAFTAAEIMNVFRALAELDQRTSDATTPDAQAVFTKGNTFSDANGGITFYPDEIYLSSLYSGGMRIRRGRIEYITPGGNYVVVDTQNITGNRNQQKPNGDGTYGLKVNGEPFDVNGSVTIDIGATEDFVGDAIEASKTEVEAYAVDLITQLINGAPVDRNTLKELNDEIVALRALVGGTAPDGNSTVDTVAEVLAIMATFPEGVDILSAIGAKISSTDIVNNLTQAVAGKVLDASQGKILKDLIDALTIVVSGKEPTITVLPTVKGGTGLGAIGTALQLLRVNAAGTALEYYTPTPKKEKTSFIGLDADYNLINTLSLQSAFGLQFDLQPGLYIYIGFIYITNASASASTPKFGFVGTATFTMLTGTSGSKNGSANSVAAYLTASSDATGFGVTPQAGGANKKIFVKGLMRITVAGSVIPAVGEAIVQGAGQIVNSNSFFTMDRIGEATDVHSNDVT